MPLVTGLNGLLVPSLAGTAVAQPVVGGEQVVLSGDVHVPEGQSVAA